MPVPAATATDDLSPDDASPNSGAASPGSFGLRWPRRGWVWVAVVGLVTALGVIVIGDASRPAPGRVLAGATPPPVRLAVGDDFAAATYRHPPGTTYLIEAGTHRLQAVTPKEGDVFVGEDGAVVVGAMVLDPTAFADDDGLWVAGGFPQEPFTTRGELHGEMLEGRARHASNHDLWLGDALLDHVDSRAGVDAPGEWFFDYDADEIVMFDDPASAPLELAVVDGFAWSSAPDVEIRNLAIGRYSSPAQSGAIHAAGDNWRVVDCEIYENHGAGVVLATDGLLEDSIVRDNGQIGLTADFGADITIRRNEVYGNGTLGYVWQWERGGMKLKSTQNARVEDNHVHDNHGPGIWFDIDNVDAVIDGNLAEDNDVAGIFYEISYGARITNNRVFGNGQAEGVGTLGSGIFISISNDVLVEDNVVANNFHEIVAVHAARPEDGNTYEVANLRVRHNQIGITKDGAVGLYVDTGESEYYTDRGNVFMHNDYTFDNCTRCFLWGDTMPLAEWQAIGNDVDFQAAGQ